MHILISILFAASIGFALSVYVFNQAGRTNLQHKAMLVLDGFFIGCAMYAVVGMFNGFDPVIPKGLVLWVLVPIDVYVGILAIHYRDEEINEIARKAQKEEEIKGCDANYDG